MEFGLARIFSLKAGHKGVDVFCHVISSFESINIAEELELSSYTEIPGIRCSFFPSCAGRSCSPRYSAGLRRLRDSRPNAYFSILSKWGRMLQLQSYNAHSCRKPAGRHNSTEIGVLYVLIFFGNQADSSGASR
jgi:hypothetical protein